MADEWREAVVGGDVKKLSDLVFLAAGSKPKTALSLLRSCVQLLEQTQTTATSLEGTSSTNGHAPPSSDNNNTNGSSSTSPVILTLENVQLLQPRGRFDLVFRKDALTVTGKAGAVVVSWDNVRHVIRLPRPEGFNWGKALNPEDPAGSDLVAIPLKDPVPFRKSKTSLVLLQPDPKAKHSEASIVLDGGASHQASGSQGTLLMSAIKLLSGVRQVTPDRGLFASRDRKSFVKCYHGVNEGSLFPLKQGLLFMKPALFLPRSHIEEVVCGRGGSATTRYVDLVVGLEVGDGEGGTAVTQQEFSNIDREALPCLQSYIQDALVAPRQREVKRTAKAEEAAAAAAAAAAATTTIAEQQQTAGSLSVNTSASASNATVPSTETANGSAAAAVAAARPAAGVPERDSTSAGQAAGDSRKTEQQQQRHQEGEEDEDDDDDNDDEDDGDDESDEDFAPVEGDTDSDDDSGSSDSDAAGRSNGGGNGNSNSNSSGESDNCNDNENDEDADDADDADSGGGGDGGGEGDAGSDAGGSDLAAERAEALRELDNLAKEAAGGEGSGPTGGAGGSAEAEEGCRRRKRTLEDKEDAGVEGQVADEEGEDTESDGEVGGAARKRQR